MNRRSFSKIASVSLAGASLSVLAEPWPVEGKHYVAVSPRQPTLDPNQVEVLEFFAYGCEHCHAFEPTIDAWQKKLPSDVRFRRIPVAFRAGPMVLHQRLYFAIESLGLVEQLHRKVFTTLHEERRRIDTVEHVADFATRNDVDAGRLVSTVNSFSVASKVTQATTLANGYRFQGTPSIGVDGRWLTSGSMAGSNPKSLEVAEHLMRLAKRRT